MKRSVVFVPGTILVLLLAGLFILKLRISERFRIAWNRTRYFYDGRHTLKGNERAVIFDLDGELWVRDKKSGAFMRLIPGAGIELEGEQNLSMSSARDGIRVMFKLRPQKKAEAEHDRSSGSLPLWTNDYFLYFEQRLYSNDTIIAYYKDAAYGPGGLFFTDPSSGDHIACSNYSTVYVPSPDTGSFAGPSNWLWAAAANRRYVETAVTGTAAQAAWDRRYLRRTVVPAARNAPGRPGDIAVDDTYVYVYHSPSTGWIRIKIDADWQ
jgi:hypothetical protein